MGRRTSFIFVVLAALVAWATPAAAQAQEPHPDQWNMRVVGAAAAWAEGVQGQGVTVAVIDSGVHYQHQDLRHAISGGRNYVGTGIPQDDNGHGTHVAGIVAAALNGGGVVGVAPRATIMPIKVLNSGGSGSPSNVADAIRWAADNGAHVINLSVSERLQGVFGSSVAGAVEYAWRKGAICVFAAGNEAIVGQLFGSGFSGDTNAIVVTATTSNDGLAPYASAVGAAKWGIAAPGGSGGGGKNDVLSTWWDRSQPAAIDRYAYSAGTSMAAPMVAGAAALLRSLGLGPQQTVDRLLATAKDLGSRGTFGAGRLDVASAVAGLPKPGGGMVSPTTAPGPGPEPAANQPAPRRQSPPRATTTTAPPAAPAEAPPEEAPPTTAPEEDDVVALDVPPNRGDVNLREEDDGDFPWETAVLATALLGGAAGSAVWLRRRAYR